MSGRRTHYELAFESFLDRRGTPYVAVDEVRHAVRGRIGAKTFDYIVYPTGGPAYLVDVKGRKGGTHSGRGDIRQQNWVTAADVRDLLQWQEVFGSGYDAAFVFAYWLPAEAAAAPSRSAGRCDSLCIAGRWYSFWSVSVRDYAANQRRLSPRWETVSVPRSVFRRLSRPLEALWPAAPC